MSAITIVASQGHGSGGVSAAFDASDFSSLRLTLAVTAANPVAFVPSVALHPTLTVWLETSTDGATGWTRIHDFKQVHTATGSERAVIVTHDAFVRAGWHATSQAAGVDPGFTWSLDGDGLPDV